MKYLQLLSVWVTTSVLKNKLNLAFLLYQLPLEHNQITHHTLWITQIQVVQVKEPSVNKSTAVVAFLCWQGVVFGTFSLEMAISLSSSRQAALWSLHTQELKYTYTIYLLYLGRWANLTNCMIHSIRGIKYPLPVSGANWKSRSEECSGSYFVHFLSGLKAIRDKPGSLVMYQYCCSVEKQVSNCSALLSKEYGKNEAPLI